MIDIIYRLCEAETDGKIREIRPPWFNKVNCLRSFHDAVIYAKPDIHRVIFVHDGETGPLFHQIHDVLEFPNQIIVKIMENSNEKSYLKCLEIAEKSDADVIYLVEDDYLHLPQSVSCTLFAAIKMGVVTMYDHLNRYLPEFNGVNMTDKTFANEIIRFDNNINCHFRTAESTCCTYAFRNELKKMILGKAREYLVNDHGFWLSLLPVRLWTPIPGMITQVDQFMSPGLDWEIFNNSFNN